LPAFTAGADIFAGSFTVFAAVLAAGFATAFAATGFVFEALLDFADFGADLAADFFDEALAMASRHCKSEKRQQRYITVALRHASGVRPRIGFSVTNRYGLLHIIANSPVRQQICNNWKSSVT
jgi:hypothetical protein